MGFPNLRLKNIFDAMNSQPIGNDLPQQGGLTGTMPFPLRPLPTFQDSIQPPVPDVSGPKPIINDDPTPTPTFDPMSRMQQLYQPEHAATDQFSQLLGQYPGGQPQSRLARLGSALAGAGMSLATDDPLKGYAFGQDVLHKREQNAIENWKNQVNPAYQAATLERYSNANNRQFANSVVSQEMADRKQTETERKNKEMEGHRKRVDDVREYLAKNPKWQANFNGPEVILFDPGTHETIKTGIKTGQMDEFEKQKLITGAAQKRVETETASREKIAGEADKDRDAGLWKSDFITTDPTTGEQTIWQTNSRTGTVRKAPHEEGMTGKITKIPGSGTSSGQSETQRRVGLFNKAQQVRNTRPDLAPYIQLGSPGSNDFTIVGANRSWTQAGKAEDAAKIKEANELIYGTGPMQLQSGHTPTQAPPAPAGWRYVPKPGGGWTAVQDGK